jgi:sugar lactone lactonase YvrE
VEREAELVFDGRAALGEGPFWDGDGRRLLWVDSEGPEVHIFLPRTGTDRRIGVGQTIGCIVLRAQGDALVALANGVFALDLESGSLTPVADTESGLPQNHLNDGKCDCAGRFWFGSMANHGASREPPTGALYRMDTDGSVRKMLAGVRCSNGIAWSPDNGVMYYIDTPTREVAAFDFDAKTGAIRNRRAVIRIPDADGLPDGMAADEEGYLWIAHWGGWRVSRYDPHTGAVMQSVKVPVKHVTSCAFGGDELDELYITTARYGVGPGDTEQPHAGGLFRARTGVRGLKVNRFGRCSVP